MDIPRKPFFDKPQDEGDFVLKAEGGSKKIIVSETDVKRAISSGRILRICAPEAIFTPYARDLIKAENVKIEFISVQQDNERVELAQPGKYIKTIAIGSDHRGYPLKEHLKGFLIKAGYKVLDMGTDSPEKADYPDYAFAVANKIAIGEACRGVFIDSIGIAGCIVVNKVKGIRGAVGNTVEYAKACREHNDVNVLCLGGDTIANKLAEDILTVWLKAEFETKYSPRLKKVKNLEGMNFK